MGLIINLSSCNAFGISGSMTGLGRGNMKFSSLTKDKRFEAEAYVPDFKLKDYEGRKSDLSAYHGKWVLLYFWTSKSRWSVYGLNTMMAVQETFEDTLQVICMECYVNPHDRKDEPSNDNPTEMLMCECSVKSDICRYFSIKGFPTRILIGPNGKVIEIEEGSGPDEFPLSTDRYIKSLRIILR